MKHLPIHPTLLHPLTGLPLQAVGVVGGRTIWPIMGASEDSDAPDDSADSDQDDDSDNDGADKDDTDNDARILIDERTHRKTAETLLAELTGKSKTEVRKLVRGGAQAAREALVAQKPTKGDDKGDKDVDEDAIRREAERAANERANARIVRSEVRALAAETFADPADAPLYVDLSEFEVDDDGEVDADEIKKALADVIKAKPHLAKTGKGPKPDRSQGPRGGSRPDPTPGVGRLRQAYADSSTTK